MMAIRLAVMDGDDELGLVATETEDDYCYFKDSVHAALEDGEFGSGFPTFMNKFDGQWSAEEVPALQRDLEAIAAAMKKLPPKPLDNNWSSKLAGSGRRPANLYEVFIDSEGKPLLGRLLELCALAREKGKPIEFS